MTALMYAAPLMGLPPMDLLLALGSLLPIGISPYLAGGLMHLATGVILSLLYAVVFERLLPGPQWLRGATFSLAPWIFAITLMRMMSLMAHLVFGGVVGLVYQRRAEP